MNSKILAAGALLLAASASATPQPLPFSYTTDTLPKGAVEVEQYVDAVPLPALNAGNAAKTTALTSQFQTEIEYGISDKLELALYVTLAPAVSDRFLPLPPLPTGTGLKQRLRYRFAEPGEWPVDVGVYGEVSETDREIELEAKILLQKRFGPIRLIANLWAEREAYFSGVNEWVINPTLGATGEIAPWFHLGVEGWLRAEWQDGLTTRSFNLGPHVYVGPAVSFNWGKLWWSTGVYARVTDIGRAPSYGNDAFGSLWARTIIGLEM